MANNTEQELRAKVNKIYSEAVMMGRPRTGSPISHVEDSILALIKAEATRREKALLNTLAGPLVMFVAEYAYCKANGYPLDGTHEPPSVVYEATEKPVAEFIAELKRQAEGGK